MTTPTTPGGLARYDHLPWHEAARLAWADSGSHPEWHALKQRLVREQMPALARALDRAAAEAQSGERPVPWRDKPARPEPPPRPILDLGNGDEGEVIVVYGRTEDEIMAQLRQHGLAPPEESDR